MYSSNLYIRPSLEELRLPLLSSILTSEAICAHRIPTKPNTPRHVGPDPNTDPSSKFKPVLRCVPPIAQIFNRIQSKSRPTTSNLCPNHTRYKVRTSSHGRSHLCLNNNINNNTINNSTRLRALSTRQHKERLCACFVACASRHNIDQRSQQRSQSTGLRESLGPIITNS